MVISDTSYMIDGFTIALLVEEFGLPLLYWWKNLGKAGITRIAYNFRRDRMTDMRPLDDTDSTKMYSSAIHFRVGLEA